MSSYDLYKPLRNRLRQYSLVESLWVVWAYLQNLLHGEPFPNNIEQPARPTLEQRPNTYLSAWELSLLAKELLLNAPEQGSRSLRRYAEMRDSLNGIKRLQGGIEERYPIIGEDILLEVYRVAHRQFPWQTRPSTRSLIRYFKIFSNVDLLPIFEREIGMSPAQLYTLGLTIVGHFSNSFTMKLPLRTEKIGLPEELGVRFLELFSAEISELRSQAAQLQSHDHDYAYTLNPLQFHPLIHVNQGEQSLMLAPITDYLLRRFTDGIYYDLCRVRGFSEAFGPAFQAYVGEVIEAGLEGTGLTLLPENEFQDGKNRKDTTDWIVSSASGHVFVECKTKRLRADAKVLIASTAVLEAELAKIAAAVAQVYKAIVDAELGLYPQWKPDGQPIYPLVVTLEDWYAWGHRILGPIKEIVRKELESSGIPNEIMDRCPFNICSASEFETAIQVMGQVGVGEFMAAKMEGEARDWAMHVHTRSYKAELRRAKANLFPTDLQRINPVLTY